MSIFFIFMFCFVFVFLKPILHKHFSFCVQMFALKHPVEAKVPAVVKVSFVPGFVFISFWTKESSNNFTRKVNPNVFLGDSELKNTVFWRSVLIINCTRCLRQSLGLKNHTHTQIWCDYILCVLLTWIWINNFAILPYCKTMTTQNCNKHIYAFIKAHTSPSLKTTQTTLKFGINSDVYCLDTQIWKSENNM